MQMPPPMSYLIPASIVLTGLMIAGCSTNSTRFYTNPQSQKIYSKQQKKEFESGHKKWFFDTPDDSLPPSYAKVEQSTSQQPVVVPNGYVHPTMRPYNIRGIDYYPTMVAVGDEFSGNASWYGPDFHGKKTSNGETYDMNDMTAAHKTLPMNTIVKVVNKRNGLITTVRINDRGPFVETRIIDLSNAAAKEIDMVGHGTAPVTITVLGFDTARRGYIPTKQELAKLPQKQLLVGFAVQVGSFSKIEGAMATQQKFDGVDGYKSIIKDMTINGVRMFRVWLSGFKTEQEARDYKAKKGFAGSFIVKED